VALHCKQSGDELAADPPGGRSSEQLYFPRPWISSDCMDAAGGPIHTTTAKQKPTKIRRDQEEQQRHNTNPEQQQQQQLREERRKSLSGI